MIAASGSLTDLRSSLAGDPKAAAQRAAREFESLVLSQILDSGSKTLFGNSPLSGGSTGRMARQQLFTELVAEATRGRGLGLAAQLERQMSDRSERGIADTNQEGKVS